MLPICPCQEVCEIDFGFVVIVVVVLVSNTTTQWLIMVISEAGMGLKVFVEGFVRGQRRLHLFAKEEDVAPG